MELQKLDLHIFDNYFFILVGERNVSITYIKLKQEKHGK